MRSYRIALAMAVTLMSFASMAQSNPARGTQAPAATEASKSTADANAASARSQRSLMGMVMGALIESAEQAARERQNLAQTRVAPVPAAHDPMADADTEDTASPPPITQARSSTVQQVAIGSEP